MGWGSLVLVLVVVLVLDPPRIHPVEDEDQDEDEDRSLRSLRTRTIATESRISDTAASLAGTRPWD